MPIGTDFMAPVLQNQEYNQREATLPAELAQKAASTRYTAALADRVEQESAADKNVAAQMAQSFGVSAQAGGKGSASEQLSGLSEMYAKAGQPSKAALYAQQAAQAQAHEANVSANAFREAASKTKLQGEQFKMAQGLLGGVKDAETWQDANAMFEKQTGQPSPFKNIPYDPKVVKLLQDASTTAYQKQQLALREEAVRTAAANVKSEVESRSARDGVALERLRVSQQREQRLAKAGGKDIGAPSKVETTAADKLLGDSGLEGDERDAAAFSIASEARVIRRKNPGVSADEALRQAALTAKQNGSIVPGSPSKLPFGLGKPEAAKFSPPQDLPKMGGAESLVKGQVYADGKGNVAEWDGKDWTNKRKSGGAGKATVKAPESPEPVDDEEDDDAE